MLLFFSQRERTATRCLLENRDLLSILGFAPQRTEGMPHPQSFGGAGGSSTSGADPAGAFALYARTGPFATATHLTNGVGTFYYPLGHTSRLPVFIFACGTYQYSFEYAPTLHHLASFGLVVLGVQDARTKVMSPSVMSHAIGSVRDQSGLPPQLRGAVDLERLAVGGHSGGGPVALEAASMLLAAHRKSKSAGGAPPILGFVAQHSAAIPVGNPQRLPPNRPTDDQLLSLADAGASMFGT